MKIPNQKKSNNRLVLFLSILAGLLLLFAIIGKSLGWVGKKKMFEVDMAKVSYNTIVEKVSASGMVRPVIEVKISPEVAGEIIDLQIKEGDSVKSGDLLLKIRPDNFISALNRSKANLNQQKANLASSRANLARAEAGFYRSQLEFNRQSLLHKDKMISDAEYELADDENRNLLLKNYISEIKDNYEYIFIDTPPTLGLLTVSSLTASDEVLIPVQCEFFALEGLSKLIKTIELVKSNLNINLKLNGIILTMYDRRNSLSSLIEREAREYFDANVYKFNVPRNVTLSEAPSHGLPAIIYDLKCSGSQAYIALAKEFLERSNLNGS